MNLKIDHFYLSVNKESFQSLLKNTELIKFCKHKIVVADGGNSSWEGLYFISDNEVYFELVQEVPKEDIIDGAVGIAVSRIAEQGEETAIKENINNLSDVKWLDSERLSDEGQPWFKSWYPEDSKQGFFFWIMLYLGAEIKRRTSMKNTGFKSIVEAKLKLDTVKHKKSLDRLSKILQIENDGDSLLIKGADQSLSIKLSTHYKNNEIILLKHDRETISFVL